MRWLTAILGVVMAIAPFVMRYSDNSPAMWTSIVLGVVIVVLSLFEELSEQYRTWEYWAAGAVGVLAIIAPFVFGFSTITWALWVMIGFGVLILLISGYEVLTEQLSAQ